MQRSQQKKLARVEYRGAKRRSEGRLGKIGRQASVGAAVMMAIATARAQQPSPNGNSLSSLIAQAQPAAAANAVSAGASTAEASGQLAEVVVTATKRAADIQSVPLAITAITSATLQNQNIQDFSDYALTVPQLSFTNNGPGSQQIYMRGVSASPGSSLGSGATVGVYLDNQPLTFPGGTVDLHMSDIARVEVLPGPQGTLYGAASEAGTIRIITNQPDPSGFHAGYTVQGNTVYNGAFGGILDGFVNLPVTSNVAVRLVGWYDRQSGYLNNVHQTITYDNGFTLDNAPFVQKHYNPVTTEGGRAMLRFNINDNWSITPEIIAQKERDDGVFGQEQWLDLAAGPPIPSTLSVAQYSPETHDDQFVDRVLTVLGKIGNFDLTYTGAYLTRDSHSYSEYADYTLAYQQYENIWPQNPTQFTFSDDYEQTYTNELRVASPTDYPVRFVAGVFQERQQSLHVLHEPIRGLNPLYWVGYGTPYLWPDLQYLTLDQPVARGWAGYIEANWDITSHLTATAGFRRFRYANSLKGFNGVGLNAYGLPPTSGISGQQTCFEAVPFHGAPCVNLDGYAEGWGSTPKFNLSYKIDADHLVYATFSRGFRPGGVNQAYGLPPYGPDYLSNYEIGWKTSWLNHRLIFNGALYYEEWKNFQFSFTGAVGIPVIANAGAAAVKGFESQLNWLATRGLNLTTAVTYNDGYLTEPYCGVLLNGKPVTSSPCVVPGRAPFAPKAPDGAMLPGTPRWKGSLTARYSFPVMRGSGTAFVEGDQTYQSFLWPNLRTSDQKLYGQVAAYGYTDFSLGLDKDNWEAKLLVKNVFNRLAVTDITSEIHGAASVAQYHTVLTPRLIGLQFSQQF